MQRAYASSIKWSLNHKALVIFLSIALLAGSGFLVKGLGFTFIPNEEQKLLVATFQLPSSTSLEKTNEVSLKVENMFAEQQKINDVTVGIGSRDFQTGLKRQNQANYFISLGDGVSVSEFIPELEKEMEEIVLSIEPDAKIGIQEQSTGGPPSNNNVNIDLYSTDLAVLQDAAARVEEYMMKQEDLKYVSNNFSEKQKQVVVEIDPEKSAQLGISGFQILGTITDKTKPVDAGIMKLGSEERRVAITYDEKSETIEDLKNTVIFTQQGPVPITEIANITETEAFTSIQKLDARYSPEFLHKLIPMILEPYRMPLSRVSKMTLNCLMVCPLKAEAAVMRQLKHSLSWELRWSWPSDLSI